MSADEQHGTVLPSPGPGDASGHREGARYLARIATRIGQLHKEFQGKGPTEAKAHHVDDLIVVLLRGGFTTIEKTLLDAGKGEAVLQQRADFQDVMVDRFKAVIEEEAGRPVAAYMSANHYAPDVVAELFVLGPSDARA